MNFILSIVLVFALATTMVAGVIPVKLNPEQLARVTKMAMECMEKEKLSKDALDAFTRGEFSGADRSVKCYANCFLEKNGIMADGVLNTDVLVSKMKETVGEDKIKTIIEKCSGVKGSDNCETAFMLFQCYHKEHADIA